MCGELSIKNRNYSVLLTIMHYGNNLIFYPFQTPESPSGGLSDATANIRYN